MFEKYKDGEKYGAGKTILKLAGAEESPISK